MEEEEEEEEEEVNHNHLPLTSSSSSSSSSSSNSRPDLFQHVQAAFKRHRPLGTMQLSNMRPRRVLLPQREPSRISVACNSSVEVGSQKSQEATPGQVCFERRSGETAEGLSVTQPSDTETITKAYTENANPFGVQKVESKSVSECKGDNVGSSSHVVYKPISVRDCQKKVQFSLGDHVLSQRADEQMATGTELISSHMSSLALTEMDWDASNLVEAPAVHNHDRKQRDPQQVEVSDISLRSDGGISSLLAKRSMLMQSSFLGTENNHPMTQSSALGSSCRTTFSVHSKSAPLLNSTTYSPRPCQDGNSHMEMEPLEEPNVNPQPMSRGNQPQLLYPTYQCTSGMLADSSAAPTQMSISSLETPVGVKDHRESNGQKHFASKEINRLVDGLVDNAKSSSALEDKSTKEKGHLGDVTDVQSQAPMTKGSFTNVQAEPSKSDKQEKTASSKGVSGPRKKSYDPDVFVKVNGKLYQKLGKIGSGGSSEVYKVISSDCTIYALKRIKLKGRDYSTAYGFCQEIGYLNKLKGKSNIIQLIDFEVTDKTLLEEVMNGAMNIKNGRIRDDGYIYMVLEYGEIDLAHMLSQKWKEQDSPNWTMDENWLRFYWQQILQAVNTIHEERIVHSDLKPANFLLVKGSLKLIDFGIAKAIMSDTTNIQRDSQVGTLSYMSPEAFLCNESDSDGNAIKCGRPSDIWSLGCILYQMVYGRTPFSEYKTFWAKFKVITDRNHEIIYGPVSNPWLLDLMKKCLAWERKDRWRIPELLQHPFLVPPITPARQISSPQNQSFELFQQIAETYGNHDETSRLCSQIQVLLKGSVPPTRSQFSTLRDQHCFLLSQVSSLCSQLQQHVRDVGS
ncbi:hypothetical protein IFM89_001846 [Coptis chinensis]|uniref:Protein kinase domain-containing protein n=1 Tax=Coptis chinensis TaxID=261450 RepID=A0A835HFZ6_9MAGN|nr:hypothetical protein IFM89_001846 [Coptis chinensis]